MPARSLPDAAVPGAPSYAVFVLQSLFVPSWLIFLGKNTLSAREYGGHERPASTWQRSPSWACQSASRSSDWLALRWRSCLRRNRLPIYNDH